MSHLHRFYTPGFDFSSGSGVPLPDEEAHHALSVARLRDGDHVAVFDGRGAEAIGTLSRQGKRQAQVLVEEVRREAPSRVNLILAPAWLHRDKPMEEIIRRGTELGVSLFVFWRASRSQRPVSAEDKWQRLAVESCKQSGRLHLPQFAAFDDLSSALSSFDGCILAAEVHSPSNELVLPLSAMRSCALIIGPEGDFSPEERDALHRHAALPVSLGRHVLRTEAATVAMATLVLNALGELGTRFAPPRSTTG